MHKMRFEQKYIYQGITDSIAMGETHGSRVGRRIILPASFIGGQEICDVDI